MSKPFSLPIELKGGISAAAIVFTIFGFLTVILLGLEIVFSDRFIVSATNNIQPLAFGFGCINMKGNAYLIYRNLVFSPELIALSLLFFVVARLATKQTIVITSTSIRVISYSFWLRKPSEIINDIHNYEHIRLSINGDGVTRVIMGVPPNTVFNIIFESKNKSSFIFDYGRVYRSTGIEMPLRDFVRALGQAVNLPVIFPPGNLNA